MKTLLLNANALSIPLADKSVHCCVTSPPYWGLRDYGTASWEGGDAECDHNPQRADGGQRSDRTLPLGRGGVYRDTCGKCGAVRIDNQLGLEQTPEAYVSNMVAVFREVWRVLRDDGSLWLNLGDSYNSSPSNQQGGEAHRPYHEQSVNLIGRQKRDVDGLKPKDLVGIPWRVAFALQADGWYLRSDIIWSKPNPMPESVRDRPTKSHEYVFLLTKSARYYFDQDAVMEKANYDGRKDEQFKGAIKSYDGVMPNGQPQSFAQNGHPHWNKDANGMRIRNIRSVWHIATAPYSGAHFATYPPALVEPCIKAGCPEGGVVLDPFAGSGTTLLVARNLGRHAIGLDLSYKYLHDNARERLGYTAMDEWHNGKKDTTQDFGPMFRGVA